MRKSVHRIAIAGSVALLLLAAAVSGQGRQPATPADELLAEVRALRAEVNNAARAGMRAQLLGMRLQLQEQRIGVVSRQLTEVQERLRANQQAQTALAAQREMTIDVFLASHASQFGLHEKYKPGDTYNPDRFVDPKGFKDAVARLEKAYQDQVLKERAAK